MSLLKAKLLHRIDDELNWLKINPILEKGELVISNKDGLNFIKIGDGITHYSNLPYQEHKIEPFTKTRLISENTTLLITDRLFNIINKDNLRITLPDNPFDGLEYTFRTYPEWFGYTVVAKNKKLFYSAKYWKMDEILLGKAESTIMIKYSKPIDTWLITYITKT